MVAIRTFLIFSFFTLLFFITPSSVSALSLNLSDAGDWNVRVDGAVAGDWSGYGQVQFADVDGNGKADLLVPSWWADNNGGNSGSVWIVSDSILTSVSETGNTLDLSNSEHYSIRIDGAAGNHYLGVSGVVATDINDDGNEDLLLASYGASYNSRSSSGSVYVLLNDRISRFTGTGNTVGLDEADSYTLRYDGAVASDNLSLFSGMYAVDLESNGTAELLMGTRAADNNSRGDSGSVWVIDDSLWSAYSGTGNNVDLSTSTNWSFRIDGGSATEFFGHGFGTIPQADVSGNGIVDIVMGAYARNNGTTDAGSLYILYDSVFSSLLESTGNLLDLATSSSYTFRIDEETYHGFLGSTATLADFDNDGAIDVVVSAYDADNGGATSNGKGWVYVLYNTLLQNYSGTGNEIDLDVSTNYNLRIQGNFNNHNIGDVLWSGDYLNTGRPDLLIRATGAEDGSVAESGSVYVLSNAVLGGASGTGNTHTLSGSDQYTLRIDGANTNAFLGLGNGLTAGDVDGDGTLDLALGSYGVSNGKASSGSVYILRSFPHTITPSVTSITDNGTSVELGGVVSATNAIGTIQGVEFLVDSTDAASQNWASCSANDSSYDSRSENYSCAISEVNEGDHTVYFRSVDSTGVYTSASQFGAVSFTYDASGPRDFSVAHFSGSVLKSDDVYDTAVVDGSVISDPNVILAWHREGDQFTSVEEYRVFVGRKDKKKKHVATLSAKEDYYVFDTGGYEGVYEWFVEALDVVGNTSSTDTYTFELDLTPSTYFDLQAINYRTPQGSTVYLAKDSSLKVTGRAEENENVIVSLWDATGRQQYQDIECSASANIQSGLGSFTCEEAADISGSLLLKLETRDQAGNIGASEEFLIVSN